MVGRAAATALPGADERVHPHPAAADARRGQECRDLGAAPPAHRLAASDRQAAPRTGRPGVFRRPAPPATTADTAPAAPDRLPGHGVALAPRPVPTSPCHNIPAETARPATDRAQRPSPRPA